ncbi:MAG: trimethylamine methyltransferase family protein [Nitrososphaerota archaeon]
MVSLRIEFLSKDDVYKIHITSLNILEKIGIKVMDENILNLLKDSGCEINYENKIAKIPQYLVMECVKKIPKNFTIYARDNKYNITFGNGRMKFMSSGGQMNIIDPISKDRKPGKTQDTINAVKLGNSLENIDIIGAMVVPQDVPLELADIYMYSILLKYSSKIIFAWIYNRKSAEYILKMLSIVAGGIEELKKKPLTFYFCEPTSPLKFGENALQVLQEFAKIGLPVCFGPMVMASATGPATLAGTLAMENAEILAGNVIAQLIYPGVPVLYGGVPHILDQKTGNISFGSPEQGIMAAAITQIGKYYGFPIHVNIGLTDSKLPDAQSGIEKAATMLMGALAGAELSGHLGISGQDMGACFEQLVIDNELADYVKRIIKGFEINDETLAFEIAEKVGIGGTFLTQKHTLKYIRSEFWYPKIFDRKDWNSWYNLGAKDSLKIANEIVSKILKEYQIELLDKDIIKEIDAIILKAKKEILK